MPLAALTSRIDLARRLGSEQNRLCRKLRADLIHGSNHLCLRGLRRPAPQDRSRVMRRLEPAKRSVVLDRLGSGCCLQCADLVVVLMTTVLVPGVVIADEKTASTPVAPGSPLAAPVFDALRREAEAAREQRHAIFARLEALPAPPAGDVDIHMQERERIIFRLRIEQLNGVRVAVEDGALKAGRDQAEEEPDDEAEGQDAAPALKRIFVPDDYFDRWMLGSPRGGKQLRDWMESLLKQKIRDIDRTHRLTVDQKKKLELAGRGDIKRLSDEVDRCRREFELVKTDLDLLRPFLREHQSLRVAIRTSPFESGSLLSKSLKKMITDGQLVRRRPS